jgi:hypothetical protein
MNMSVRKIGGKVLVVVLAAIAAKAAFSYGVSAWVEAQAKSPEFAYRDLYAELGTKSQDHHNLVSYYASCVDSGTVGVTGRGIPIARDGVTRDCMDKTASWSQKLALKVPFATIRNDIVSGEAQVYLRTRNQ